MGLYNYIEGQAMAKLSDEIRDIFEEKGDEFTKWRGVDEVDTVEKGLLYSIQGGEIDPQKLKEYIALYGTDSRNKIKIVLARDSKGFILYKKTLYRYCVGESVKVQVIEL